MPERSIQVTRSVSSKQNPELTALLRWTQSHRLESGWEWGVRVTFDAFVPLVPASELLALRGGDVGVVGTVYYRWDHTLTGRERNTITWTKVTMLTWANIILLLIVVLWIGLGAHNKKRELWRQNGSCQNFEKSERLILKTLSNDSTQNCVYRGLGSGSALRLGEEFLLQIMRNLNSLLIYLNFLPTLLFPQHALWSVLQSGRRTNSRGGKAQHGKRWGLKLTWVRLQTHTTHTLPLITNYIMTKSCV